MFFQIEKYFYESMNFRQTFIILKI